MPLQKIISCNFRIIEKNQGQHYTGLLIELIRHCFLVVVVYEEQPCVSKKYLPLEASRGKIRMTMNGHQ